MQVYEAIVRGLEGIGVRAAFGGAGENAASLMLALKHSKKIRPIMTRHEQAASFKVVVAIGNSFNQHATFNYHEDLFTDKLLIHINISETEIDKAYKADHALIADAKPAVAAITDALERRTGPVAPSRVDGRDYEARHIPHLTGAIHPGRLAQTIGRRHRTEGGAPGPHFRGRLRRRLLLAVRLRADDGGRARHPSDLGDLRRQRV